MREEVLFIVDTPYRQPLHVKGWRFGNPARKSLAVVGALRGNEIQQMYVCSRLIQSLAKLEADGMLADSCGILVVPCVNHFSMNVGRRFWAADNTDINRMFPGYEEGETTQRIAARLFNAIKGYHWGVHLPSFYLSGRPLPHVRIIETGYQKAEEALDFGLPYIELRKPRPYDTTVLNYNWQIWDTQAFSIYTSGTDDVDVESAECAVEAVLRFLWKKGLSRAAVPEAKTPRIFWEETLHNVTSKAGGLMMSRLTPGSRVASGDTLAEILEPCTGTVLERLQSGAAGTVFFVHRAALIDGHEVAFRILPDE